MKALVSCVCLAFSFAAASQSSHAATIDSFMGRAVTVVDSSDQYVWVGTEAGLYRICKRNKRTKYYSLSNTGYTVNRVFDLCCQEDGCVWVATNNGLIKYDNYAFILYSKENSSLPEDFIVSVGKTDRGELLVGTSHRGYVIMQRNKFHPYELAEEMNAASAIKNVRSLMCQ